VSFVIRAICVESPPLDSIDRIPKGDLTPKMSLETDGHTVVIAHIERSPFAINIDYLDNGLTQTPRVIAFSSAHGTELLCV
jgi:hypothetical protein